MTVSPSLIDAILVLVAVEFAGLLALLAMRRRLDAAAALFFFLASGAALLSALRAALAGGEPGAALQALLGLSFVAHIGALVFAWRLIARR